jgi:hypothetical protein
MIRTVGEGTIPAAADLSSPAGIRAAVTEVAAQVDHVDATFSHSVVTEGRGRTGGLSGLAAGQPSPRSSSAF